MVSGADQACGLDHPDQPVAGEGGVHHCEIAGLEDVERQNGAGEQKGASQREDRDGDREVGRFSISARHEAAFDLDGDPTRSGVILA